MPSFVCDECQSTLKKAKLDNHASSCGTKSFSCIDCGVCFRGTLYRSHTQCITEAEKYEKKPAVQPKRGLKEETENQQAKKYLPCPEKQKSEAEKKDKKQNSQAVKKVEEQKSEAERELDNLSKSEIIVKKNLGSKVESSLYQMCESLSKDEKKQLLKSIIFSLNKQGKITLSLK